MSTKNPWETKLGKKLWKTESGFMSFVRGGIRRGLWEKNPLKLEFIKANRERVPLGRKTITNPKGLIWGGRCNICKELFKQNELQVDHVQGGHSLKSAEDISDFIVGLIFIDPEVELQLSCKPCHKIKSHAERKNISFEQAKAEKEAIKIIKEKKDKTFLERKGIPPSSNQQGRREQLIEYLLGEESSSE